MEITFITIHDLSPEARILYSSDSIIDILGHTPDEVAGKSAWEFFDGSDAARARPFYSRSIDLDKAAVLAYCWIRNRRGQLVCCECCFSIVYNVVVACTSIYHDGIASQQRAVQAPIVRRLFSSSSNDPRYHMLQHISSRFSESPAEHAHEPRAALFLNRFTRTLTIMYATSGVEEVLGISADNLIGNSFWYCIQYECLDAAVRCTESAKANDSIAYLRFMFQDPRYVDSPPPETEMGGRETDADETEDSTDGKDDTDASMTGTSDQDDDASVNVRNIPNRHIRGINGRTTRATALGTPKLDDAIHGQTSTASQMPSSNESRTASTDSNDPRNSQNAIFDTHPHLRRASSRSSPATSLECHTAPSRHRVVGSLEIEAVISCTSDGLVVCIRRARPVAVEASHARSPQPTNHGTFAAPWASDHFVSETDKGNHDLGLDGVDEPRSPPRHVLDSIGDMAVFAWALVGINENLATYSRGTPSGQAQPAGNPMRNSVGINRA